MCFFDQCLSDIGLLESMKCQSEPFASKSCEGLIVNLLCAAPGQRTKVLHSQVLFRSLVFFLIFQHFIIRSGVKNRKLRETILIWLLLKLGPNFFYVWKEMKVFLTNLNQSLKLKPSFVNWDLLQQRNLVIFSFPLLFPDPENNSLLTLIYSPNKSKYFERVILQEKWSRISFWQWRKSSFYPTLYFAAFCGVVGQDQ